MKTEGFSCKRLRRMQKLAVSVTWGNTIRNGGEELL